MKMGMKMLGLIAALAMLPGAAIAGDINAPATKAPAAAPISFAYPDQNGLIVSLFTEGGGGSVVASVPGVPPASLTTTTAGVGATIGWMWTPKKSAVSLSFEGDIEAQNFNGNNAGLSVQGPLRFEQRIMVYAPWQQVFAALPQLWNPFSSISAFTLPSGFTATGNAKAGLGLFYTEADISSAFQGLQAGKVWRGNPGLIAMTVQPVSTGGAFRIFAKWDFLNNSKIFGQVPAGGPTLASLGSNGFRAGVGYAF